MAYASFNTGCIYSYRGGGMAKAKKQGNPLERHEISGIERLGLRVSEMINHPVAQIQRWVTIHRLDTDGDREWGEVMVLLSETDGIDMTFNDDESVTLRWEPQAEEDRVVEVEDGLEMEEVAPF
jgi:hypothetical protein